MDGLAAYLDSRGNWISDCDASGLLTCQQQCILLELTVRRTGRRGHLIADLSPLSLERVPHHSEPEAEICVPVVMRAGGPPSLPPSLPNCPMLACQQIFGRRPLARSSSSSSSFLPYMHLPFSLPSSIHSENNLDPSSLLSFCPKSVRLTRSLGYRFVRLS